jgi:hypothetical protein
MGCSSEKCIPVSKYTNKNKKSTIITEDNIEIDLHDIEKQGESKHPQREINNKDNIEEENNNYYNYNLNELIPINQTKMTVKRLENFEDDEDESESEENKNNLENIEEEKSDNENGELDEENNQIEKNRKINDEQEKNNISKFEEDEDKKPEDKKPPNIQKLKKKGKQKKEINLF